MRAILYAAIVVIATGLLEWSLSGPDHVVEAMSNITAIAVIFAMIWVGTSLEDRDEP